MAERNNLRKNRRDIGFGPWQMKQPMFNQRSFIKYVAGLAVAAVSALSVSISQAQSNAAPPAPKAVPNESEVAVIKTTEGDMVIEFWTDAATNTVANFKKLAKAGFYDGTAFHRIIKGFMAQGGDPNTKDPNKVAMYGGGGPGYAIADEKNGHKHDRGVIAMANAGPNTAGSQFYICLAPQPGLDAMDYTTFGHLIKGDDTLEKIGNTPVAVSPRGEMSAPTKRVEVLSIKIVPASSVK